MTAVEYKTVEICRICGNEHLTDVMDFGEQYLASTFVESNEKHPLSKTRLPLTVSLCDPAKNANACGLVQLRHTVPRDVMYREYFYRSATNPMMREALGEVVQSVSKRTQLAPGDYVLDIGANDGTMLTYYPDTLHRVGIDPAKNINRTQLPASITFFQDYFGKERAFEGSKGNKYKAVTAIAMFYDLDDPNAFVRDLKEILAPGGLITIQLSYLGTTIDTMNFYDICHEHLLYYSLRTLSALMNRHGLKIIDALHNDVNGGSVRIYAVHAEDPRGISFEFDGLLKEEEVLGLTTISTYQQFMSKVHALKEITRAFLDEERKAGGVVVGLGASTKGNVLLQFFDIDKEMLPYISDRNPEKVGLRTLGTDIEVSSEEAARAMNPSAMLVSIWFFKDEIIKRERAYLEDGGKLFFPMPYPHVVTKDGEKVFTGFQSI